MNRIFRRSLCVLVLALGAVSLVSAAPVLDQEFDPRDPSPGGGLLAVIPFTEIPVDPEVPPWGRSKDWVYIDLTSSEISVTEGDRLAIVLKLDTGWVPPDPDRTYDILWHGKTFDPYPRGGGFVHIPIRFPGVP